MPDQDFSKLEKTLDIKFANQDLIKQAFIHRSYLNENRVCELDHNERLEFLGDAVLDIIVSDKLYNTGQFSEGDLTELRSQLVKEQPLAKLFDNLEMAPLVRSAGISISTSVKSDIVEAFFAVIYLDKGIKKCQEVFSCLN